MSSFSLPAPINTYAGQDALKGVGARPNGQASTSNGANGGSNEESQYRPPKKSDALKEGLIFPAKAIRDIIDKTALHISKSPTPILLEAKIKEHQKMDPKFSFLNDEDPYHQYYRFMIEKVREDAADGTTAAATAAAAARAAAKPAELERQKLPEPRLLDFVVDMPSVTAQDLDILRLTALFEARRGRSFLAQLSQREGRNFQFEFLRPQHSLYGYYNRTVAQYVKIFDPLPEQMERLEEDKWATLEHARERAAYEKQRRTKNQAQQKEQDEEAVAFAEVDWQDFVLVETIEFTSTDTELALRPPISIKQMQSMSLAEKRMASTIQVEEAVPTVELPSQRGPTAATAAADDVEMEIEMEDDEDDASKAEQNSVAQEQARARELQRAAMESKGFKVRKDYVPKGLSGKSSTAMSKCPNCLQLIPETELSEHIRIELLDPKWKEQKQKLDERKAQAAVLQQGADVSASLKGLANARTDLFGDERDEDERKRQEEEERLRRREREKIIWDGHTASKASTESTFQGKFSVQDQMRLAQEKAGLPTKGDLVGPGAGLRPSAPQPGKLGKDGSIKAGPQGPSQPYASGAPAPGQAPALHPSRMAALGGAPVAPAPVVGQTRPFEGEAGGATKRQRVEKLPYGQLYSEYDWIMTHQIPISLSVQLPNMPEKPEWKLDGSVITLPDVPANALFSNVRERIRKHVDADLPVSRIKIDYHGKAMANTATLASVNIDETDLLVMSIRDGKKK